MADALDVNAHPVATAEQHAHELAALELIEHPTVKAAYDEVKAEWLMKANPSPDMSACFDEAFHEVMFSAAVWSSNQDPLRPKVTCITRLAHPVSGRQVPGSRWGIDNPDSIYRVIPISGDERYLLHGRVGENRMTENYFTLWDDSMNTVDVLSGHDLELDADGNFTITVNSDPHDGRPNHVQSAPGAHEFYIRDVMLDWSLDDPNHLAIERLGAEPSAPARTIDEQAQLTAEFMAHYAKFTRSLSRGMMNTEPNNFHLPHVDDQGGSLRNQVYVGGHFALTDDTAMLIHLSDADAGYFVVPVSNIWGTTLDVVGRTSSLNKAQSVPNADGTYTYVVSTQDPGVHNWVDPCGMSDGILTVRMAEFPSTTNRQLWVNSETVALADLDAALPDGMARVSSEERATQLAERGAGYHRRLPEVR
jgi:hypothetical protein